VFTSLCVQSYSDRGKTVIHTPSYRCRFELEKLNHNNNQFIRINYRLIDFSLIQLSIELIIFFENGSTINFINSIHRRQIRLL
jgi:hypothetical protein